MLIIPGTLFGGKEGRGKPSNIDQSFKLKA